MNNCEDKIRLSCPPGLFSKCVKSELTLPTFSTLSSTCNSVEDIDEDQYRLVGQIKEELNLNTVVSSCETLPTLKSLKNLIQFLLDRDCAQQEQIDILITQNTTQASQITALQNSICS